MKCEIVKTILDNQIVIYAVKSTCIVNAAIRKHSLSPVAAAALGRMLTAVALMGASLKNKSDYLTATINGGGQTGSLVCCADGKGMVKGYVENPVVPTVLKPDGHLDVGGAVGCDGTLRVIKNIGLKTPYIGTSHLVSGEIAQDFAQYFATSEQQPCSVALGVKLNKGKCVSAGGVFVQVLPSCSDALLSKVETICYAMDEISHVFDGRTAKQVVDAFFLQAGEIVYEQSSFCSFRCDCSRRRIARLIRSMGEKEVSSILDEMGYVELTCQFCGKHHRFEREDVEQIFHKK